MQRPADATPDLISISEAARKLGLNKSTLARQLKSSGVPMKDGKVSFASVLEFRAASIDLTRSRRRDGLGDAVDADATTRVDATISAGVDATIDADATPDATIDGDAEPVIVDGKALPYSEARALKETYLARLRKLEFEQKNGSIVSVEDVGRQVEAEYALVRERLIGIPGKLASELSVDQRMRVEEEIREALTELHAG